MSPKIVTYQDVSKYVEVPLAGGLLPTGLPVVLRLEPMPFLEWAALGRSVPMGARQTTESGDMSEEAAKENLAYAAKVVAKAARQISAAEEVASEQGTVWMTSWLDIQVLAAGQEPDPANPAVVMYVSELDRGWNILNAFNALAGDAHSGGPMTRFSAAEFRA